MSSFLLSALQRSVSYSHIRLPPPPLPLRAGSMPIISSHPPASFMLTSSLFISPRCACASLWSILARHSPGFDRHSPPSLLHLSYAFYSLVLCPLYLCFIQHMRMFPFLLQNPAPLIFASLHPLPLCLSRSTDRVHILRLSSPSLSRSPSPKLTASLYTTDHPYHPILTLRNDLLVRCVIAFAIQNPAYPPAYRIFRELHFRCCSPCISHSYSITFTYLAFPQSIFGPPTAIT